MFSGESMQMARAWDPIIRRELIVDLDLHLLLTLLQSPDKLPLFDGIADPSSCKGNLENIAPVDAGTLVRRNSGIVLQG
jgi:hypothetical protein